VARSEDILALLLHKDKDQRPDVYHLTWFPDREPWDVMLPLAASASVVEVHDAILNRHPEYHPDRATWEWYHRFVRRLVRNSDRLLVHSRSVVGEIVTDLDGDGDIVDVAPLAVDPVLTQPLSQRAVAAALRRLGIQAPPAYFVALGKDYPHKDQATMFRALARLKKASKKYEGLHIVCAGSRVWHEPGETTDELLRSLGIESSVSWVQEIPDADVKALLQGSAGLIYPSLEEGFGLPPLEAMALGTPVAACASMSIPEVCGDGALLFQPGDDKELAGLMQTLLAGGQPVADLIQRGHAREQGFSWKHCADATVACYRQAIEAGKQRSITEQDLQECLWVASHSPYLNADEPRAVRDENQEQPPVLEPSNGSPRRRWSLRRRLRKIRDGLKKRLGEG
jgi:alpha-1,3-rhamnosyl/mannosyltransferase